MDGFADQVSPNRGLFIDFVGKTRKGALKGA
jgi:hypothetical protein